MIKTKFTSLLKWLIHQLGDESPKEVTQTLYQIRDNHLLHLQMGLDDLNQRVGQLEGKMWVLITVALIILGSVVAPLAVNALSK